MGHPVSEETRLKLSKAAQGRLVSPQTRKKISKANLGRKYGPMSDEQKRKLSETSMGNQNALGHSVSKEARRRISENCKGMTGKHHSEKAKQEIGKANSRHYPAFVNNATGEIIPAGINLLALCKERGFTNGMYEVKNGNCRSYRGWTLA